MSGSGYVQGSVGIDPLIQYSAVPSGGAVALKLFSSSSIGWSLTRYVSQNSTLVSGIAIALPTPVPPVSGTAKTQITFLDIGDGTNVPLNPSLTYVYTFTTSVGSISTPALPVGANIQIVQDDLTMIIIRILQAGLASLALPPQFKNKPTIYHAMPITGQPTLPMIAVSNSFIGQAEVPIGQANQAQYQSNVNTTPTIADRIYSVCVLTTTVAEREFYRDAIIGIFNSILGPVLESVGQDVRHSFAIDCGQVVKQEGMMPGFYYAEAMLKVSGLYNVVLTTQYGIIETILPEPNTSLNYVLDFPSPNALGENTP